MYKVPRKKAVLHNTSTYAHIYTRFAPGAWLLDHVLAFIIGCKCKHNLECWDYMAVGTPSMIAQNYWISIATYKSEILSLVSYFAVG